jgi:hypothetical protein
MSSSPTAALPAIDGCCVLRGAAFPETTSLGRELAVFDPLSFDAVTRTCSRRSTSPDLIVYARFVAPPMF